MQVKRFTGTGTGIVAVTVAVAVAVTVYSLRQCRLRHANANAISLCYRYLLPGGGPKAAGRNTVCDGGASVGGKGKPKVGRP